MSHDGLNAVSDTSAMTRMVTAEKMLSNCIYNERMSTDVYRCCTPAQKDSFWLLQSVQQSLELILNAQLYIIFTCTVISACAYA